MLNQNERVAEILKLIAEGELNDLINLKKLLDQKIEEEIEELIKKLNTPEKLRNALDVFSKEIEFKKRDLVKWKPGMKNKKYPLENVPAIVVEKLDTPIYDDSRESGSPYFREPLDLIIGIISHEGEFITYYVDSRRFERWKE